MSAEDDMNDNRCKEYPAYLQDQKKARYYTVCRLTVEQQWVSDTLIKGNEVFTAEIIKRKLEERGYDVNNVEEFMGDRVGWHAKLFSYPSSPEEWEIFLQRTNKQE